MAVAVKNPPEVTPRQPLDQVALGSWIGTVYVLVSIALVFYAVPNLWAMAVSPWMTGARGLPFVDAALRILAMVAAGAGLFRIGQRLVGPSPAAGTRAGVFVGILTVLAIVLVTQGIGRLMELGMGPNAGIAGPVLLGVTGLGLLALGFRLSLHPSCKKWLLQFEEQGWFSTAPYKRAQGQRVRRGTILGVLVLSGCGIYSLLSHRALEFGLPDNNNWALRVPFFEGVTLVLLPDVRFTAPILLALATLWLAYRIINYPTFADFLIATEAEMNKVSWTTRKRLVQDTIVVLTTVFLITVFIFAVDVAWGWGLSRIGVLQVPEAKTQERKQIDW